MYKPLSPGFKLFVFIVLLVVALVSIAGCGMMHPYAKVNLGHVVTDVQGSDGVGFISEVGTESGRLSCAWTHFSMVNRGWPLESSSAPEPHLDYLGCGYKFGGQ